MALFKIEDFNPNYRQEAFGGEEIKGIEVYTGNTDEKIGTIHNILVDETGRFRYLVIDMGFWIFGKKVLLPVGRCYIDVDAQRINAIGLFSKEQAEKLPEYDDDITVNYDYEERVRDIYRTSNVEASAPVEKSLPVEASGIINYSYEQEPEMYDMNEQNHHKLKLYEEKLVANKHRQLAGEVSIGKRVETKTVTASVPVEKERIVIERTTPENIGKVVTPTDTDFRSGEVARMEVYQETVDIQKQAFVREEVNIKKEVQQDSIEAQDTIRREELEVNVDKFPTQNEKK